MQTFKDSSGEIWQFEDDVEITNVNGVYSFVGPHSNPLKTPTTLQPYTIPAPTAAELAAIAHAALVSSASALLNMTDMVCLRCYKAGVTFPAAWQTYTTALRAIVNGTDTTSSTLPTQPVYPAGT